MMSPLDADLGRAAGRPERDLDMAAVRARATQLRRRRRLGATAGSVAFASIAVLVALTLSRLPSHDVASHRLPLPSPGEALGTFIDDVPVWVVQTDSGEVFVLRAVHPDPGMMHAAASHSVGCRRPSVLLESPWGSRFLPDGTALGGPAPEGLHRFEVEDVADGHVVVGALRAEPEPLIRSVRPRPDRTTYWCTDPELTPHPGYEDIWGMDFETWRRDWYSTPEDRPGG